MMRQKKSGTEISYDFKTDHIHYLVKDKSGSRTFNIPYEDISDNIQKLEEKKSWWPNVGWILVAIGAFQIFQILQTHQFQFPLWLFSGCVCLGIYYSRVIKYSLISAGKANLLIIKDGQHNKLIAKIKNERRRYLRDTFFKLDPCNDKGSEARKLCWLKENNIITQEEFDKISIELLTS